MQPLPRDLVELLSFQALVHGLRQALRRLQLAVHPQPVLRQVHLPKAEVLDQLRLMVWALLLPLLVVQLSFEVQSFPRRESNVDAL